MGKSHNEDSGANRKTPLRDAELLLESGIIAYREGRTEDAIRDLEAAIEIEPKSYSALFTLGNAYARLGHHDKAIKAFQLSSLLADSSELHANIGNSYMALKDYASAKAEFKKAIELDPNYVGAQNTLSTCARCDVMKGRYNLN
jgi:tetratricopeptide (TPR) repeat protein